MSITKVTGMMQTSTKGGDITSASPCVIDTDGDYFDIAGTVSFAAFTVTAGRRFTVQFDGALTMTHHATTLDLPGGANITTAAGDVAEFFATGTNTVQCVNYTKADGTAVVAAAGGEDGLTNNSNTTWMTVSSDEEINMPLQPCVNAYNGTNDASTTGDGTVHKVELDLERFDQGGDHNVSTDTFTAPITGRYLIIANVANNAVTSSHTQGQLRIFTSNETFPYHYNPYASIDSQTTNTQCNISAITEMESGDVCYIQNVIGGAAKSVGTSSGVGVSFMCVHLLA